MRIDLRRKELKESSKTPVQGVLIVVLSVVLFLMWLGLLVIAMKLLMG